MGTVYRGRDHHLARSVALKCVVRPHDKTLHDIALREAKTLASISHPNILQIYDIVTETDENNSLWLVCEWLEGQSLAQMKKPIHPIGAAAIGIQILEALLVAFDKQIIHRDLKPSNVIVCSTGRVVLIDFGVAFAPGSSSGETLAGSPRYLSPRLLEGEQATEQTDLFAVGLILLELSCGQPVVPELAPIPLYRFLKSDLNDRVDELCEGLCPPIISVVKQLLRRDGKGLTTQQLLAHLKTFVAAFYTDAVANVVRMNDFSQLDVKLFQFANERLNDAKLSGRERAQWMTYSRGLQATTEVIFKKRRSRRVIALGIFVGAVAIAAVVMFINSRRQGEAVAEVVPVFTQIPTPAATPTLSVHATVSPTSVPVIVDTPTSKPRQTPRPTPVATVVPQFSVTFASNVWANFFIDNEPMGRLPRAQPFSLKQGRHRIRLENPLAEAIDEVIFVTKDNRHFQFTLEAKMASQLFVLSRPGRLIVDDSDYGEVTNQWVRVSFGKHKVRVVRPNGTIEKEVYIGPNTSSQIFIE